MKVLCWLVATGGPTSTSRCTCARTRNCSGRWRAADAAVGEVSALQENLAAKEPEVEETRELKAAWMETLGDFFGVGELARGPSPPPRCSAARS